MSEAKLQKELQTLGKAAFVDHFDLFREYAAGARSRKECIEELVRCKRSNPAGASMRCGAAKRIFGAKKELEALRIICDSNVSGEVRRRAEGLLESSLPTPSKEEVMSNGQEQIWFDDYAENADDLQVEEYDITAVPNDFNVMTLHSFIESGVIRIPGFQRNFVWDLGRASKLIESLILGLPVPQLFLYEQDRNKFLVIDGQQRLMSIYYFVNKRFPRKEKRAELRSIFDQEGHIPAGILHDDQYFQTFNLQLSEKIPNHVNRFKGLNYETLGDYKTSFDLRPIRNILVKQNSPSDDDSSMYEVFNRLNSGGVNLYPQEIRTSMYHSDFYNMLYAINTNDSWRHILRSPQPDLHMRDIEVLLRGFAMLVDGPNYAPSMVKFLNQFSRKCETLRPDQNHYLRELFLSFLNLLSDLPPDAFINKGNNRFNIALYEAVFTAICEKAFAEKATKLRPLMADRMRTLELDSEFVEASQEGTTRKTNVEVRLNRARAILCAS